MVYAFTIVGIVIAANFYMFYARRKKSRAIYQKANERREASDRDLDNLKRKLNREQANFAKRVELQNRTFQLYDQVRRESADSAGRDDPGSDRPEEDPGTGVKD